MAFTIQFTPGKVWIVGDRVTVEALNAAANPTINLEGTLSATSIPDGAITTAKLATDAVETVNIKDRAVTTTKIALLAVTSAEQADSARLGVGQYAVGTFTAGVYAITLSPVATAYTAGMRVVFKADADNTGATDINVNSLGAKNIYRNDGTELAAGEILNGQIVEAVYNGTDFRLLIGSDRLGVGQYAIGTLTTGVYAVPLAPGATAYTAGMRVVFKASADNTGATDINVNSLGAKNIYRSVGTELQVGDILSGQIVEVVYDGTNFQLLNVSARSTAFRKWAKFNGEQRTISITRSGTTATATIASGHGISSGMKVNVSGATQTEYNGTFTVTGVTATTFTYEVSGSPATPATGSPKLNTVILSHSGVASITRTGTGNYLVTFTDAFGTADYSITAVAGAPGGGGRFIVIDTSTTTSGALGLYVINSSTSAVDTEMASIQCTE